MLSGSDLDKGPGFLEKRRVRLRIIRAGDGAIHALAIMRLIILGTCMKRPHASDVASPVA